MRNCDQCGNSYENLLEITQNGKTMVFDSFECAIQKMAPTCGHCSCRIIGHGIETSHAIYCCAHCANTSGVTDIRDHSRQS